jgi:hypothetical protein
MKLETVWTVLIAVKARAFASRMRGKEAKERFVHWKSSDGAKKTIWAKIERAQHSLYYKISPYIGP